VAIIQGFWKKGLRLLSSRRKRRAGDRIRERHAEHVGERQRKGPTARDRSVATGADDDAGQNRHHRQHARCQR
jgi:hypothetical protein